MSQDQLQQLIASIKVDSTLREKIAAAQDLDAAAAIANEYGFSVSKSDWTQFQDSRVVDLNDQDLEGVAGGYGDTCYCAGGNTKDPADKI